MGTSWSPLPSDPKVTNRYTSLSSTSRGWLMKMQRKLLCRTDNLDTWRSDRVTLGNHFSVFAGADCCGGPWLVVLCAFVMESKVRPLQMDELVCWSWTVWTDTLARPWPRVNPKRTSLRSTYFSFVRCVWKFIGSSFLKQTRITAAAFFFQASEKLQAQQNGSLTAFHSLIPLKEVTQACCFSSFLLSFMMKPIPL